MLIALGFQNTSLFWILSNKTYLKNILKNLQGVYPRECSCCGFHGKFKACGRPPRYDARCPQCGSLERHR
jgi:predicted Zn-ribbon and HTH transcriptional regulator